MEYKDRKRTKENILEIVICVVVIFIGGFNFCVSQNQEGIMSIIIASLSLVLMAVYFQRLLIEEIKRVFTED